MIRVQPIISTYLHFIAGRSHSIISRVERFPEWRLTFGSGNMLPHRSDFKRGLDHDAALQPKCSGSVTGRLVDNG